MPIRRLLASICALSGLALPATASAAERPATLPPVEHALKASPGAAARVAYTAPMSGFVTVRLNAARGDWDLRVADARTRRALAASEGFSAREVAQLWVASGQRLLVQGVRRRGAARSASVSIRFADVAPPPAATPSLVRVRRPSREVIDWLDHSGFDVTHNRRAHYADVVVPDAGRLDVLRRAGLPFTRRIADLNADFARSRRADARYAARVSASPLPSGRTGYRKPEDYQRELKQIVADHPQIARPVTIGESFQGRPIEGVELATDVAREDDGRPFFLLVALHHAREWPSGEMAMEFAHLLADGHGSDPELTDLLDRERVVIVPVINPDGFFASRSAAEDGMFPDPADATGAPYADTAEGVVMPFGGNLAYRRKNCNGPVPSFDGERDLPCYYQWGVDPNRNYGEGWGGPGASPDPNTQTFRGDDGWSEPETQAVHEFSQRHPVSTIVSLHNVAALVLRPPARGTDGKAPDEDLLKRIGDAMADVTGYQSQYSFQLYDTSGTTEDWNYAAAGSLGYTVEIGPVNGKFHMPYETGVVREWEGPEDESGTPKGGMREALLIAARAAADPAHHSVITGAAQPGTVLRVRKAFQTRSSPVCTYAQGYVRAGTVKALDCVAPGAHRSYDDHLEYTTVVPPSGTFSWHVTPSTRPFVGARYVEGRRTDRTETYSGKLLGEPDPAAGQSKEIAFRVEEADHASQLDLRLDWTSKAEDYDLRLFYVEADGSRTPIGTAYVVDGVLYWTAPGSGGNPNGLPEHIVLAQPPVGDYVAEVVNATAVLDDWTLTVEVKGQEPGHVEQTGQTEAWTLICETPAGQEIARQEVTVARGATAALGEAACRP